MDVTTDVSHLLKELPHLQLQLFHHHLPLLPIDVIMEPQILRSRFVAITGRSTHGVAQMERIIRLARFQMMKLLLNHRPLVHHAVVSVQLAFHGFHVHHVIVLARELDTYFHHGEILEWAFNKL